MLCARVCGRSQWCSCVVSCRSGDLVMEVAVCGSCGQDVADACAYLVYLSVGGGKRLLEGRAEAQAPEGSVDGVDPTGQVLLWAEGGGSFSVSGPALTCVLVVGMAQIQQRAAVVGQCPLIHLLAPLGSRF